MVSFTQVNKHTFSKRIIQPNTPEFDERFLIFCDGHNAGKSSKISRELNT